jgi:hypothetical protein
MRTGWQSSWMNRLLRLLKSITGALAAGPKHWTVMTGHIVQAMLKGKLLLVNPRLDMSAQPQWP